MNIQTMLSQICLAIDSARIIMSGMQSQSYLRNSNFHPVYRHMADVIQWGFNDLGIYIC